MANPISGFLFCIYCELGGHEVVACQAMYEYLGSLATIVDLENPNQGTAFLDQQFYCVARWGAGKKRTRAGNAALSVTTQGTGDLNPAETHMLATYLEHQRLYWLWCRSFWTQ